MVSFLCGDVGVLQISAFLGEWCIFVLEIHNASDLNPWQQVPAKN